jgi:hypothetical protein
VRVRVRACVCVCARARAGARDGEGEGEGESFPALTRTLVVPSLLKASKSVRFENILILYSCPFPRARGWGILFI